MKILQTSTFLDGVINHFFLHARLPHVHKTIFPCGVQASRAINITSLWPEKANERAQTWSEMWKFIVSPIPRVQCGWWWRTRKPEANMLHCGDDPHSSPFSLSARFYLPVLFSGLINWLIGNKTTSHAGAHIRRSFPTPAQLSFLNPKGFTNTHIVSGLRKKMKHSKCVMQNNPPSSGQQCVAMLWMIKMKKKFKLDRVGLKKWSTNELINLFFIGFEPFIFFLIISKCIEFHFCIFMSISKMTNPW